MPGWLLVAMGSAIGGAARYGVVRALSLVPGEWPAATMAVNLLGSFLIGALWVAMELRGNSPVTDQLRLIWMMGVLGGFTTYSAFALETVLLGSGGSMLRAGVYIVLTVTGCVLAAIAGRALAAVMFSEI